MMRLASQHTIACKMQDGISLNQAEPSSQISIVPKASSTTSYWTMQLQTVKYSDLHGLRANKPIPGNIGNNPSAAAQRRAPLSS